MIEGFAAFILKGRVQSVLIVSLFSAMSLLLPPLGHVSGGALSLVTLRRGAGYGTIVVVMSLIVMTILAGVSKLPQEFVMMFLLASALILWLPTLLASVVLGRTRSLGMAMMAVGALSFCLLVFHALMVGDVAAWWRGVLQVSLAPALARPESPIQGEDIARIIDGIAMAASGMLAATIVVTTMVNLFLGRWLQAIRFNPGGFREEFLGLRLNRTLGGVAMVTLLVSSLSSGGVGHFAFNLLLILVVMFALQGLALVHATVEILRANRGWLVGLYGLMVFLLPQVMVVLSAAGFADCWLNFRSRLAKA